MVLHAEIDTVMLYVSIELFEASLIEQDFEPLARGQFAFGMLRIDTLLPPAHMCGIAAAFHFGNIGGHALSVKYDCTSA